MKNSFYVIVFVLALATAYAVSQTQSPAATPNTAPPAGQQATQPDGDSPAAKTQDEPAHQNNPGAGDESSAAPAATDDAAIRKQVEQQLASQRFGAVTVAVNNGLVTLTGSVPTKEDRKRARELAKAVPGVRKVDEKLEVKSPSAAIPRGTLVNASAQQSSTTTAAPANTAGSIAGNTAAASGTQSGNQTPPSAQGTTTTAPRGSATGPATSTTPAAGGTAGTTTGGVTGAATSTTPPAAGTKSTGGAVATPATPSSGTATTATGTMGASAEGADLQPQIESALKSEPTLAASSVTVNVTGDTIELSGSVPTGKEKQTAKRIAQSFAGNRKVVDRITVTGRGIGPSTTAPTTPTPPNNSAAPNANEPPNAKEPAASNPNSQGDSSAEPR